MKLVSAAAAYKGSPVNTSSAANRTPNRFIYVSATERIPILMDSIPCFLPDFNEKGAKTETSSFMD